MTYFDALYLFLMLPVLLAVYQLLPKRFRWISLLAASLLFYWSLSGRLIVWVLLASVWTWLFGLLIARSAAERKAGGAKKTLPLSPAALRNIAVAGLLGTLAVLKYTGFIEMNIGRLIRLANPAYQITWKNFALPIGISFYTLDAVGYLVDISWEKMQPERSPFRMLLYLSFFPKVMEGPILSGGALREALFAGESVRSGNLAHGSIRICWGLFKELVIANRLAIPVNMIFDHYTDYHGAVTAVSGILYALQLYMDFSGTMDVVIGSAELFGIRMPENFSQPFFAKNASEFWRRWHISLGVWFRTYIFYPVSLSKPVMKWNLYSRKKYGRYVMMLGTSAMCLFPVWLANGLWHGPQWNYIFYGMYYFVILMLETALGPVRKKAEKRLRHAKRMHLWNAFLILKTWIIIFSGEMFFRANGVRAGFSMFASMFRGFSLRTLTDGTMLRMGLSETGFTVAFLGILVVLIYDICQEKHLIPDGRLGRWETPVRWTLYYALIFAVFIFGAYGAGYQKVDMIYAGF